MSALQMQHEFQGGNTWEAKNDLVLMAVLGTLGFKCINGDWMKIILNANAIINFVDKNRGTVSGLSHVSAIFELYADNPHFGRINCVQIAWAYELAKLSHDRQVGDGGPDIEDRLEKVRARCHQFKVTNQLSWTIQYIYDMLPNFFVLCVGTMGLMGNPLLKFSKSIRDNGVGHTLNPLEAEDVAFRRSERLFRGEAGRVQHPTR